MQLKKDKRTEYVLSWKSKGIFNSESNPLNSGFLHAIKLTECRIGIKFVKTPLAVEQNKYLRKIVNVHIVFDSDAGQKNPSSNFKFKDCFLVATSIAKNSDNEKYMY